MNEHKWGFHWAILITVSMVGTQWFLALFLSVFIDFKEVNSPGYVIYATVLPIIICFLTVYLIKYLKGFSFEESILFLGFKKPNYRQLMVGLLSVIPTLLVYGLMCREFLHQGMHLSLIPNWFSIGLFLFVSAGIFEEVFFRGFLFQFLRNGRSFSEAAALYGTLWSLVHFLNFSWGINQETLMGVGAQVLEVFILSFSSAYLFERGGNVIWGWMLVHLTTDSILLLSTNGLPFTSFQISIPKGLAGFYFFSGIILSAIITFPLCKWLLPENKETSQI